MSLTAQHPCDSPDPHDGHPNRDDHPAGWAWCPGRDRSAAEQTSAEAAVRAELARLETVVQAAEPTQPAHEVVDALDGQGDAYSPCTFADPHDAHTVHVGWLGGKRMTWTCPGQPTALTNTEERPEDAARRFAGELERLDRALTARDISPTGPLGTATVDAAIRAVDTARAERVGLTNRLHILAAGLRGYGIDPDDDPVATALNAIGDLTDIADGRSEDDGTHELTVEPTPTIEQEIRAESLRAATRLIGGHDIADGLTVRDVEQVAVGTAGRFAGWITTGRYEWE